MYGLVIVLTLVPMCVAVETFLVEKRLIYSSPPPFLSSLLDKSKKKGGFEEAMEENSKAEQQKKQFPGLSMPDDFERAKKLLEPTDVKVAKEALSEVGHVIIM